MHGTSMGREVREWHRDITTDSPTFRQLKVVTAHSEVRTGLIECKQVDWHVLQACRTFVSDSLAQSWEMVRFQCTRGCF